MTKVKIRYDIDEWEICMNGHAGYGPKGSDIVCAGVSLLAGMIGQTLAEEAEDIRIHRYIMDEENANVCFEFKTLTDVVNNKIMMAVTGFELLAHSYSDYVSLDAKGV